MTRMGTSTNNAGHVPTIGHSTTARVDVCAHAPQPIWPTQIGSACHPAVGSGKFRLLQRQQVHSRITSVFSALLYCLYSTQTHRVVPRAAVLQTTLIMWMKADNVPTSVLYMRRSKQAMLATGSVRPALKKPHFCTTVSAVLGAEMHPL